MQPGGDHEILNTDDDFTFLFLNKLNGVREIQDHSCNAWPFW